MQETRINTGDSILRSADGVRTSRTKSRGLLVSGRTRAGRQAKAIKAELLADLSAVGPVPAAKRLLAASAARTAVLLGLIDNFLLSAPRETPRAKRWKVAGAPAFRQALETRERLASRLSRDLGALGLERPETAEDFNAYLERVTQSSVAVDDSSEGENTDESADEHLARDGG